MMVFRPRKQRQRFNSPIIVVVVGAERWGYPDDQVLRCRAFHLAPVDANLHVCRKEVDEASGSVHLQSCDERAVVEVD